MQCPQRHPPRFSNSRFASRHGDIVQMRESFKAFEAAYEHFPAPDAAVAAVPRSIEREPDDRAFDSMLCHAGGDVRVVMLHGDDALSALRHPFLSPARRQVAWMQVVNHSFRFDLECVHHMCQRFAKEFETCKVLKVAQMLALIRELAASECKDILEVAANGEQRRRPVFA